MTTPAIPQPNYTQVPNVILDDLLPLLGFAELKVLMFLILDVHKDGTFKVQLSETFLDDPDWLRRVRRSLEAQSPEEAAQP